MHEFINSTYVSLNLPSTWTREHFLLQKKNEMTKVLSLQNTEKKIPKQYPCKCAFEHLAGVELS